MPRISVSRTDLWAERRDLVALFVAGQAVGTICVLAILPAFVVGWYDVVLVAAVGVAVQFAADLAVGIAAYRFVMSREWPRVAPLDDDEW